MGSRIVVVHVPHDHMVRVDVKPWRVWTAIPTNIEPINVPEKLQHHVNAFLEDETHDWCWKNGVLRYYSRCVEIDEEAWIYLEYKSE